MVPIPFWEVLETPIHTTYKSPLETCGCGCSIAVNDWKKSNSPWVHPVARPGIHDSALQDLESGVPSARGRTANAEIASRCEGERIFFLPSQIFKHLVVRIFVWRTFVDVCMFFFTLWEGSENIGWFWSSKEFQMGGLGLASVASVFGSFGGWALKVSRLWRTSLATVATQKRCGCRLLCFLVTFTEGFDTKTRSFSEDLGPIQSTGPRCDKDAKVCWEWEAKVMSSSRSYTGDDAEDIHIL